MSSPLTSGHRSRIQRSLLAWYRAYRRDLPWRANRDPYRIWVAEIMLQQTRINVVEPYYDRFLKIFPSVDALARARPREVLQLWAGLGYYRRARNLHRAARQIVARHGRVFPGTHKEALALPGIGRYTAAAILSIAYDVPLAALDGNVARVLARLCAVRGIFAAATLAETCIECPRIARAARTGRLEPGANGTWGNHLHAANSALWIMSGIAMVSRPSSRAHGQDSRRAPEARQRESAHCRCGPARSSWADDVSSRPRRAPR